MTTAAFLQDPFSADALAGLAAAFGGEPPAGLDAALAGVQAPNTAAKRARLPLPGEMFLPVSLPSSKDQSRLPSGAAASPSIAPSARQPAAKEPGPFDDLPTVNPPTTRPHAFADLITEYAQPAPAPALTEPQTSPLARLIKGEKQEASPLYDILRSAGTGLRSGAEGLVGLPGDIGYGMRWLNNAAMTGLGFEDRPDYVAGTGDYAQPFDLPTSQDIREKVTEPLIGGGYQPQTRAGRYARTVSEFLPGSLIGPGGMIRNAIAGGVLPGTASEAAGQAAEGTENEGLARALAAITTGVGGGLLFGPKLPPNPRAAERTAVVDAAKRQGIHIPEAAMPDRPQAMYAAGKLGQIPFLGTPLQRSAARTVDQLGDRLDEISGSPTRSFGAAADQTRDALVNWQTGVSPARMTQMYDDVDNIIAQSKSRSVTTPLSNTMHTFREVLREMAEDTTTVDAQALRLVEDAVTRPGGLTYEGLKRLRTKEIGGRLSGSITPEPGTSQPALKRLYGALTDDLRMSVYRAGGPKALRAWEAANDFTREIKARQADIARIIGVRGQNSSSNIAHRLLDLATSKRGGNVELLQTARRAAAEGGGAAAWEDLSAAAIQRLGRDPSSAVGAFSPERMLTELGKYTERNPQTGQMRLTKGAEILFGRGAAMQLEDLRLISEAHRNLMRKGNPSGTGGVVSLGAFGTGMFAAPMTTLASVGGGRALSMLLARPAGREAITKWARARNGALKYGTSAAFNSYVTASNDLAPHLAMESGREEANVARELMGQERPALDDPFGDL